MSEEFSDRTLHFIMMMQRASKTIPEDYFMVPAMQELAQLAERNEATLSVEDIAMIVGVGALLIREGRNEMMAGIQAALALRNIGARP